MYISFQKLSIHFPIFLNKAPKETSKWVEMLLVQFQFSKKYSTLLSFHNYEIDQNLLIIISEFIKYWTNSYIFILCLSNLKTLFLASNKWTSNIQSNRAITRFIKLLIEQNLNIGFSNIEWSWTCSSFDNCTQTPFVWLRTIEIKLRT